MNLVTSIVLFLYHGGYWFFCKPDYATFLRRNIVYILGRIFLFRLYCDDASIDGSCWHCFNFIVSCFGLHVRTDLEFIAALFCKALVPEPSAYPPLQGLPGLLRVRGVDKAAQHMCWYTGISFDLWYMPTFASMASDSEASSNFATVK